VTTVLPPIDRVASLPALSPNSAVPVAVGRSVAL
jgi:hypothetical protein